MIQVKDADRPGAVRIQSENARCREGFRPCDASRDASALQKLNENGAGSLVERRPASDAKYAISAFHALFVGAGRGDDVRDGVRRTVLGLRVRDVDMVGKIGHDPLDRIAHFDLPAPVYHAARHVDLRERKRRQGDLLVIFEQRHGLQ